MVASSYLPSVIQNEGPHNPPEEKLSKFTCLIKRMNSSSVRDLAKGKLEDRQRPAAGRAARSLVPGPGGGSPTLRRPPARKTGTSPLTVSKCQEPLDSFAVTTVEYLDSIKTSACEGRS